MDPSFIPPPPCLYNNQNQHINFSAAPEYYYQSYTQPVCQVQYPGFSSAGAPALPANVLLHAPVPLLGQSQLLSSSLEYSQCHGLENIASPSVSPECFSRTQEGLMHEYTDAQLPATFLTPSELLVELAAQDLADGDDSSSGKKLDTARKARRRAVTRSVGFDTTDPDTISSHEKKRHYLECLEQYILFLHEQLHLVGAETPQLQRIAEYRGLKTRSIRTLMVHMENTTRKLNLSTLAEEQKFIRLRDAAYQQQEANSTRGMSLKNYEH